MVPLPCRSSPVCALLILLWPKMGVTEGLRQTAARLASQFAIPPSRDRPARRRRKGAVGARPSRVRVRPAVPPWQSQGREEGRRRKEGGERTKGRSWLAAHPRSFQMFPRRESPTKSGTHSLTHEYSYYGQHVRADDLTFLGFGRADRGDRKRDGRERRRDASLVSSSHWRRSAIGLAAD